VYYFSYGSNMLRERLAGRVGDTGYLGAAHLSGFHLAFSKRSADGSGKCTLIKSDYAPGVWGVVFELTDDQKLLLDGFEGEGYAVAAVRPVVAELGVEAYTYIARQPSPDPALRPYTWYKELVLAGALQAGLPVDHVGRIRSVSSVEDTDCGRALENRGLLSAGDKEMA